MLEEIRNKTAEPGNHNYETNLPTVVSHHFTLDFPKRMGGTPVPL